MLLTYTLEYQRVYYESLSGIENIKLTNYLSMHKLKIISVSFKIRFATFQIQQYPHHLKNITNVISLNLKILGL